MTWPGSQPDHFQPDHKGPPWTAAKTPRTSARHPNMLWSGRVARDNNRQVRIGDPRRSFRINDFWRRSRPGVDSLPGVAGPGPYPNRVTYAAGTPLARTWSYDWDDASGWLNSSTDVDNTLTTEYSYDALGRPKTVTEAGLSQPHGLHTSQAMRFPRNPVRFRKPLTPDSVR